MNEDEKRQAAHRIIAEYAQTYEQLGEVAQLGQQTIQSNFFMNPEKKHEMLDKQKKQFLEEIEKLRDEAERKINAIYEGR